MCLGIMKKSFKSEIFKQLMHIKSSCTKQTIFIAPSFHSKLKMKDKKMGQLRISESSYCTE